MSARALNGTGLMNERNFWRCGYAARFAVYFTPLNTGDAANGTFGTAYIRSPKVRSRYRFLQDATLRGSQRGVSQPHIVAAAWRCGNQRCVQMKLLR